MIGYRLFAKEGTKFLYYFSDSNLYEICSWEDTSVGNPLVGEIVRLMATQSRAPPAELPAQEQKESVVSHDSA
jgi:hypothetical protein